MTGFGAGALQTERLAVTVEVKSVNNRYLKVLVRTPESHAALEPPIERRVREALSRGTATVAVRIALLSGEQPYRVNERVVREYMRQLKPLGGREEDLLAAVLSLPGVVEEGRTPEDVQDDWTTVEAALNQALANLEQMRLAEGRAMQNELHALVQALLARVDEVDRRAPVSVASYRDRLVERVGSLLADQGATVAASDLIREVSIFAERTDVAEETARLRSHAEQFDQTLAQEKSSGRKLEFLAQEMFRECNTIGAKSGDAAISACSLEMKSLVERIREMVANVE